MAQAVKQPVAQKLESEWTSPRIALMGRRQMKLHSGLEVQLLQVSLDRLHLHSLSPTSTYYQSFVERIPSDMSSDTIGIVDNAIVIASPSASQV